MASKLERNFFKEDILEIKEMLVNLTEKFHLLELKNQKDIQDLRIEFLVKYHRLATRVAVIFACIYFIASSAGQFITTKFLKGM